MKVEDIERMYYRYTQFRDAPTVPWSALSQHAKGAFAAVCRACEQRGIDRARDIASTHEGSTEYINWSALDAEIAKENEDG